MSIMSGILVLDVFNCVPCVRLKAVDLTLQVSWKAVCLDAVDPMLGTDGDVCSCVFNDDAVEEGGFFKAGNPIFHIRVY